MDVARTLVPELRDPEGEKSSMIQKERYKGVPPTPCPRGSSELGLTRQ